MRTNIFKSGFLVAVFLFLVCPGAFALEGGPDNLALDFRVNNPGARANAMGGAFIGLADDATAAFANPAGLTILTRPEISFEVKTGTYTTTIFDASGNPNEYEDDTAGPSFLSFVYPSEKATVAFYRHQLLNQKTNFFWQDTPAEIKENNPVSQELTGVTWGIGMGIKLVESLSLGLSVGYTELEYYVERQRFDAASPTGLDFIEIVNDSDYDEHLTASLLWNPLGELNIGFVYRQGPKFKTRRERLQMENIAGNYYLIPELNVENILKVPDVYGLGVSYRLLAGLTILADVNYVEYSDILDDFRLSDNDPGAPSAADFHLDDEYEFRAGLEYILDVIEEVPLALRGGYYFRPDHKVYYTGPIMSFRELVKKGDDDHIFSLGAGAVFFENVQVDVGASLGDTIEEYILSFVYRFE